MPRITELIVPMNAVRTVSNKPVTISLDLVHKAVRQGSTETSVTKYVVVVLRNATKTRGSVRGRVQ